MVVAKRAVRVMMAGLDRLSWSASGTRLRVSGHVRAVVLAYPRDDRARGGAGGVRTYREAATALPR